MVTSTQTFPGPSNGRFPRALTSRERELLESVLPEDRPGYCRYRRMLEEMVVLGEGRRGRGNLLLGRSGTRPDLSAPLPPVIAHGAVVTIQGEILVTIREMSDDQIDVEILPERGGQIPGRSEEVRRWSFSSWSPSQLSPCSNAPVREVSLDAHLTLAICAVDRRIWLHDARSGMNHLVPVTGFHEALMSIKNIRDPRIVLRPSGFFALEGTYSDAELRSAFVVYNCTHPKVEIVVAPEPASASPIRRIISRLFSGKA